MKRRFWTTIFVIFDLWGIFEFIRANIKYSEILSVDPYFVQAFFSLVVIAGIAGIVYMNFEWFGKFFVSKRTRFTRMHYELDMMYSRSTDRYGNIRKPTIREGVERKHIKDEFKKLRIPCLEVNAANSAWFAYLALMSNFAKHGMYSDAKAVDLQKFK